MCNSKPKIPKPTPPPVAPPPPTEGAEKPENEVIKGKQKQKKRGVNALTIRRQTTNTASGQGGSSVGY